MLSLSRLRGLKIAVFSVLLISLVAVRASAQSSPLDKQVSSVLPDAQTLYLDLHQHPELSSHETRTAAELANRLRTLGYEVTEHVGGTGIVAILKPRKLRMESMGGLLLDWIEYHHSSKAQQRR